MSTRPITQNPATSSPPPGPAPSEPADARAVASATVTPDELHVEAALMKGAASDGVDVELFSGSAKLANDQFTVQAALSRVDVHTADRRHSVSVEKLSVKVNTSQMNPDGSVGFNVGAGANLIGAEGTVTMWDGGGSFTAGLSAGVGAELGIGTRDFDKDGRKELCTRVSVLFLTVGACVENPF